MKDEASYVCDSCGEEIVLPIDMSAGSEVNVRLTRLCCRGAHSSLDRALRSCCVGETLLGITTAASGLP